jgi:hypothetical protein
MPRQSNILNRGTNEPSAKDRVLGVVFGFSGLLCFALSFTVLNPNGRPVLFFSCLCVCLVCLAFVDNKKGVVLGFLLFLLLRTIWAFMTFHAR